MRHAHRGFTLIELVIVVTVLAILAAIAVPTFFEQLAKSRRSEAKQGLSDLQLRQEKWRTNHATYGTAAQVGLPASTYYDFAVTTNTGTDAVMTATPKAAGPQNGDKCGTYTLRIDNDNNNAPAGQLDKTVSTAATGCW